MVSVNGVPPHSAEQRPSIFGSFYSFSSAANFAPKHTNLLADGATIFRARFLARPLIFLQAKSKNYPISPSIIDVPKLHQ